jgi:hypothetical protein
MNVIYAKTSFLKIFFSYFGSAIVSRSRANVDSIFICIFSLNWMFCLDSYLFIFDRYSVLWFRSPCTSESLYMICSSHSISNCLGSFACFSLLCSRICSSGLPSLPVKLLMSYKLLSLISKVASLWMTSL